MRKLLNTLLLFAVSLPLLSTSAAVYVPDDMFDMTTIDAATRAQVIDSVLKRLKDSYVFPEVAKKMEEAIVERARRKEYDQITDGEAFARKLTEDLQQVSQDKHLRVRYSAEAIPEGQQRGGEPTAEERANFRRFSERINHGFERVERMPGNIGYIELRGFFDPDLGKDTVAAAMRFVSNTDALIFDLRQNGGGDPAMVALICSYLFGAEPVHLNDLHWREGNRIEEFWTKPGGISPRYEGKDIYVLTSNRTFSGAEEFSYNLKNLKRATIVGETTGGGANPGGSFRLHAHFGMFVPTGYARSPITKTNWEGTGVKPDVDVPKEQALKVAYLMALKKAQSKVTDEGMKRDYGRLIEQAERELEELKGSKKG